MAAPKKNINLLPKDAFEKGLFGRLLKWGLVYGRRIIVFTELIVIVVFFSRFKLDRDLLELNEAISDQRAVIVAASELEAEVRFLHQRLVNAKRIHFSGLRAGLIIEELTKITPIDIYFSEINIEPETVFLSGISLSNSGLAVFLEVLNNSSMFRNLDLQKISSKGEKDSNLEFEITINRILDSAENRE